MHYTKIELKGYKRLALSNIEKITISPQNVLQLILGTNGCGKSSLLREITVLPSHPAQYRDGGHKLLELSHNNNDYVLLNKFEGKNTTLSIKRNGVELFTGSTATEYKYVIKKEFGITPEIQELIDGVVKFSTMDVASRRTWFTALSKTDFKYAFEFYGKLKSRIRDLQGSLSVTNGRLAEEISKLVSDEEIEATRHQIETYSETLTKLIDIRVTNIDKETNFRSSIDEIDFKLTAINDRVKKLSVELSSKLRTDIGNIPVDYSNINAVRQATVISLQEYLVTESALNEELVALHEANDSLQDVREHSIEEFTTELNFVTGKRKELLAGMAFNYGNDEQTLTAFKFRFESVCDRLQRRLETVPDLDLGLVSSSAMEELKNKKAIEIDKHRSITRRLQEVRARISLLEERKNNHESKCPKCTHTWIEGFDPTVYLNTKNECGHLEVSLANSEMQLGRLTEVIEEYRVALEIKSELTQIFSYKELDVIRRHIENLSPRTTSAIFLAVDSVRIDMGNIDKVIALDKNISRLDSMIFLRKSKSDEDINRQKAEMDKLENRLASVQERTRVLRSVLINLESVSKIFSELSLLNKSIYDLLDKRTSDIEGLKKRVFDNHIGRLISAFRQEIGALELKIARLNIQQGVIEQIKLQIRSTEEELSMLKQAEEAMSPSSGLIAKGLVGFINWFIEKMNKFVSGIWSYPLEIMPIEVNEEIDLDYKFRVSLDNKTFTKDIRQKECNNSTCEVFDLAFRIIAMKSMGLGSFPLQLDEFGSSFDHAHRNIAIQAVTSLITTTEVQQIFMVSHFEQSYGSLKNCDVIVLNPDNVVLPQTVKANATTKIE